MTTACFEPKHITPTDEQLAIQQARRKYVVVEANAGAAKTTTLGLRLGQALVRGAEPQRILALTYTNEAVKALRQTLDRLGLSAQVRRSIKIQTFDAFCADRLLDIEGSAVPAFDKPELLKPSVLQAIERVMGNPDERFRDEFAMEGTGEGAVEGLLSSFAKLKGTMQLAIDAADRTPTPMLANELGHDYLTLRVYWAYEHLRRGGHPDHHAFRAPNDATYDLAKLLLSEDAFADMPKPLALGLHLILVDEMHDTNRAMFTVLKQLLQQNPTSAFVGVGDRDQVIHAVAGADADFMGSAFDSEVGIAHRYPLTASYRFGAELAAPVGRLSRKSYVSHSSQATEVQVLACDSAKEANWHITQLITSLAALPNASPASETAILLRQAHQSVDIENHLLDKGIAYRTSGFDTYLMRPEVLFVRGLIAYARDAFAAIEQVDTRIRVLQAMLLFCGSFVESEHDDAHHRQRAEQDAIKSVAHTPELAPFFIENQVLRNARPDARDLALAAIEVAREDATDILLHRFVQALNPQKLAARVMVCANDIEQVGANVRGLIQSASTYDNVTSFFRAMNEREVRQKAMHGKDCIVISSIEAAKGLEFEHVLIPGLNKGEFAIGGNTADNRNLLYVGMTRARQRLTLLYDRQRPSHYLVDAGLI
ncbi:MAG: ATP-dependent helicase [Aquabacterium sp.]|nr:ATP-dependent helicase [Aquabacterium sp.]